MKSDAITNTAWTPHAILPNSHVLEKLLFPLVAFKRGNLSVKPYKLYFVQLCLELSEHNLPMIVRNSNQFNGSLSTVILENINTISVVSGDNESTPSTKRGIDA